MTVLAERESMAAFAKTHWSMPMRARAWMGRTLWPIMRPSVSLQCCSLCATARAAARLVPDVVEAGQAAQGAAQGLVKLLDGEEGVRRSAALRLTAF